MSHYLFTAWRLLVQGKSCHKRREQHLSRCLARLWWGNVSLCKSGRLHAISMNTIWFKPSHTKGAGGERNGNKGQLQLLVCMGGQLSVHQRQCPSAKYRSPRLLRSQTGRWFDTCNHRILSIPSNPQKHLTVHAALMYFVWLVRGQLRFCLRWIVCGGAVGVNSFHKAIKHACSGSWVPHQWQSVGNERPV